MKVLSDHLFANEAKIGDAIRSPTINEDDNTPSSKLLRLKCPLNRSNGYIKTAQILSKTEQYSVLKYEKTLCCNNINEIQILNNHLWFYPASK